MYCEIASNRCFDPNTSRIELCANRISNNYVSHDMGWHDTFIDTLNKWYTFDYAMDRIAWILAPKQATSKYMWFCWTLYTHTWWKMNEMWFMDNKIFFVLWDIDKYYSSEIAKIFIKFA